MTKRQEWNNLYGNHMPTSGGITDFVPKKRPYRPRTDAQRNARNSKTIRGFTRMIASTVDGAARASAAEIADAGLKILVNQTASFSDYTGVLINSYQAGIIRRGKWRVDAQVSDFVMSGALSRYSRLLSDRSFGTEDKKGKKTMHLLTSYRMDGTTPISFASPYKVDSKGKKRKDTSVFELRNRRNPKSKEFRKRRRNMGKSMPYEGFGTSGVRKFATFSGGVKNGYNILFDNGAPYAWNVQLENEGSWVFPRGASYMDYSHAFGITKKNLQTAVNYVRKHKTR